MKTNLFSMLLGVLSFMFCSCHAQVGKNSSSAEDNHSYVDLGLPSGTLWATCNIGANSPEEYGDYFAWGETEGYNDGKTEFGMDTYKWFERSPNRYTKYWPDSYSNGFSDNKTELELEDDAAYVNWGLAWRMPSGEQLAELINRNYTNTEWTTQNGVNGYKIMSKTNGKSIFLPAAGYRENSSLRRCGPGGYYWSRTLSSDYSDYSDRAWILSFSLGDIRMFHDDVCDGHSVRPVRSSE